MTSGICKVRDLLNPNPNAKTLNPTEMWEVRGCQSNRAAGFGV